MVYCVKGWRDRRPLSDRCGGPGGGRNNAEYRVVLEFRGQFPDYDVRDFSVCADDEQNPDAKTRYDAHVSIL